MKTVIEVTWFTPFGLTSCIGIVVVENKDSEHEPPMQAFIGTGFGISEEADIQYIIETGAKLELETVEKIVAQLSKGKEERILFSKRMAISERAFRFCEEHNIQPTPFNIVTALNHFGQLKESE